MKRRSMIAGIAVSPWLKAIPAANAAGPPYRVRLIGGEFSGDVWRAGVRIDLDQGWETYWRNPGDAGIPPDFNWSRSVGVANVEVSFPVPSRFRLLDSEAIGYQHQVVFPVAVTLADQGSPRLALDLFFAVCKEVCIPATAAATLEPASPSAEDTALLAAWMKQVPVAGTAVTSASLAEDGTTPVLVLRLAGPTSDIFVETASSAYFGAPVFSSDGGEARLKITGLETATALKGAALKLTVTHAGSGIEQTVTVE